MSKQYHQDNKKGYKNELRPIQMIILISKTKKDNMQEIGIEICLKKTYKK